MGDKRPPCYPIFKIEIEKFLEYNKCVFKTRTLSRIGNNQKKSLKIKI